jgi:heat-inducible transcriptional repressor
MEGFGPDLLTTNGERRTIGHNGPMAPLTPRQAEVLRRLVETHVSRGQPVGSKWLAEQADLPWRPSTIRAELAKLEELGLLQHPHTSAGRVPTDSGYRYYVDELLEGDRLPAPRSDFRLTVMRREVEETLRATTEQLSQVTNLLAIVSAPPLGTTTIRHIEVLLLQPQLAMVVVITSTGGVTKRVVSYDQPVDPGLVDWAAEYLNESISGMAVGARMIPAKLADPALGAASVASSPLAYRRSPSSRKRRWRRSTWRAPHGSSPRTACRSCHRSTT